MKKGQTYGDGSISYDEKKKRWVGRYEIGRDANGNRKRKVVYGKTKGEVKQKLKQISLDIYTGDFVELSDITIYHLGKQMLDDKLNLGKIKESTYFRSCETLKRLSSIYNTPLQSCNVIQIKNFLLKETVYSQSVLNKEYNLLNEIFRLALKRGIVSKNIMLDVEKPNSRKKKIQVRGLNMEERKKLVTILRNNDIRYSNQMLLSLFTGMRMGEINALEVSDVNFNFNTITISKTISVDSKGRAVINDTTKTAAGTRTIVMTNDVKVIIKNAIGEKKSGQIFLKPNGSFIPTSNIRNQFARVRTKYGFIDDSVCGKVDLHSLRHTYATMCIEAGMKYNVLQRLLGHTDISITLNTYTDVFDNHREDEVAKLTEYIKKIQLIDGEEKDSNDKAEIA